MSFILSERIKIMKNLNIGMKSYSEVMVNKDNIANTIGSGSLEVFATPIMAALMEKASLKAIELSMENDETTVGTMLNITHSSPTPIGMRVKASAEVIKINGREIIFKVIAEDEKGIIGEGIHKRVVVSVKKFLNKTNLKKN